MINCSPELKQAFLSDRSHKNIEIEFEGTDFSKVNFYAKRSAIIPAFGGVSNVRLSANSFVFRYIDYAQSGTNYIYDYTNVANYLCISFSFTSFSITPIEPEALLLWFNVYHSDTDYETIEKVVTVDKFKSGNIISLICKINQPVVKISEMRAKYVKANGAPYTETDYVALRFYITNFQLSLGINKGELPYNVTTLTQVQLLNYDIDDYINVLPLPPGGLNNEDLCKESFKLTESICSRESIKFGTCESAICEFDCVGLSENANRTYFKPYISVSGINERIPLGRFRINSIEKQGSNGLITKHVTAYDGLEPLNIDVSNWYATNMGVVPITSKWTGELWGQPKPQYVKQNFSVFASVCKSIGLDLHIIDTEPETILGYDSWGSLSIDVSGSTYLSGHTNYTQTTVYPVTGGTIQKIEYNLLSEIKDYFASRSISDKQFGISPEFGGIFVDEYDANSNFIQGYCVNSGEYFMVSDDCNHYILRVMNYISLQVTNTGTWEYHHFGTGPDHDIYINVYKDIPVPDNIPASKNWSKRLVYYNWQDYSVSAQNCTARDVIRSCVELTGNFLRYGRDGQLEFIQCTKSGLYPSNTLYPSDDLHPRQGASNELLTMNKYRSFTCEDYTVGDYGKIQILLQSANTNEPTTKTFVGSENKKNTYIIDDNLFLCAQGVSFELYSDDGGETWKEPTPELIEIMENMYDIINNCGYVPHETIAPGMPWFECGDRIGLLTNQGGIESFVFRRTLSGIQFLTDNYEASGEEIKEAISDYGAYDWRN